MIKVLTRNVITDDDDSNHFCVYANRATRQIMRYRDFSGMPLLKFYLGSQAIPISVPVVVRQAKSAYRNLEGVMFGSRLESALSNYLFGAQNLLRCNQRIYRFFSRYCSGDLNEKLVSGLVTIPQDIFVDYDELSNVERFIYHQRYNAVPEKIAAIEELYVQDLPLYHEVKDNLYCELQQGE